MANRINLNQTSFHGAGAIKEIAAEVKVRGLNYILTLNQIRRFRMYSTELRHLRKRELIILSQSAEDLLWIHPKQSVSSLPIRNSKM